jgi:hypothetical protein
MPTDCSPSLLDFTPVVGRAVLPPSTAAPSPPMPERCYWVPPTRRLP